VTDEKKTEQQSADDASHAPDVVLDLDTLERENAPLPFTFRHAGRRYMLRDPQDVDYQEEFFAASMASWKMKALMDRYQQHYGLSDPKAPAA
jgi:hypothetical protein